MKTFKFNGVINLKNGKTEKFCDIHKYNDFIINNNDDILSTSTSSEFVEEKEQPQLKETFENEKNSAEVKGRKLSDIIKIALSTVSKEIDNVDNNNDEQRNEICNRIGGNCEEVIKEYINRGELIKDVDECRRIIDEFFEESKDKFNRSNDEYNKIVDDIKKLSERGHELIVEKGEKIKARKNEDFKCSFSNGMRNMVNNMFAELIPDDAIPVGESVKIEPEIKTEFKGEDAKILNLSEIIENMPWINEFLKNDKYSKQDLSNGIKRLLKSIYDEE